MNGPAGGVTRRMFKGADGPTTSPTHGPTMDLTTDPPLLADSLRYRARAVHDTGFGELVTTTADIYGPDPAASSELVRFMGRALNSPHRVVELTVNEANTAWDAAAFELVLDDRLAALSASSSMPADPTAAAQAFSRHIEANGWADAG